MPAKPETADSAPLPSLLPWLGLAIAFSPVIADLGLHMIAHPWARYALWFPLLFALGARSDPGPVAIHRSGTLWLALGLALELFAGFAGTIRLGRLGLALAAIGLGLRFGLASPRVLVLAALAVPVPAALMTAVDPLLPTALLGIVVDTARTLGADVVREGHEAVIGGRGLALSRFDSGLALAVLLAGLSWYHSARTARDWPGAVARAGAAALLALPLQALLIALALLCLPLDLEAFANALLTHATWLLVAPLGIGAVSFSLRQARSSA